MPFEHHVNIIIRSLHFYICSRSGTVRGKEIKKGGGGRGNWGSDKQDAKKAEGHVNEEDLDQKTTEEDVMPHPLLSWKSQYDN